MAKITPNRALIEAIHGALGDLVYYQDAEGNLIVQRKGKRKVPPSDKQLAQNDLFQQASVYGNHVKTDPVLAAQYRPLCRGRMRPYQAAVRDFLTPPKIGGIDLQLFTGKPGDLIRLLASDDTCVIRMHLAIRDAASGIILEEGPAEISIIADEWIYRTTHAIPGGSAVTVEAAAEDRPGNIGMAKVPFFVS